MREVHLKWINRFTEELLHSALQHHFPQHMAPASPGICFPCRADPLLQEWMAVTSFPARYQAFVFISFSSVVPEILNSLALEQNSFSHTLPYAFCN